MIKEQGKIKREGMIQWVPLEKMRVREEVSQRKFDSAWAQALAKDFDLETMGLIHVNHCGDTYWIVDGQHRKAALELWMDCTGAKLECMVYENLSEQQEARKFLDLNRTKGSTAFDKYRIALAAGDPTTVNIDAIVRLKKLRVSRQKGVGAIACVSALYQIHRRGDDCLATTLHIAYHAFGDAGLDADILTGIAHLPGRYKGLLDEKKAISALNSIRGGAPAVRARAERLRQQFGSSKSHCTAAACIEYINRGGGGKKLPNWWKASPDGKPQ